jgi:hypothetical protein
VVAAHDVLYPKHVIMPLNVMTACVGKAQMNLWLNFACFFSQIWVSTGIETLCAWRWPSQLA